MSVHLLVGSDGRTVTTGCGQTIETPDRRPPDDVTGWGSDVTCPDCLARRKPR